jgi:hypothetical protein
MATIEQERNVSSEHLLQEVSQLDTPDLDRFMDQVMRLRAERRAPRLSKNETKLLETINYRRPAEAQARFDWLVSRRRANKLSQEERTELVAMTHESEIQAAERVRAVAELARLRGIPFDEMLRQLGI